VDNALKYAPKETPVSVRLHTDVSKAVLSVADEGSGIPQAEKKKIFYKFYRIGNEITRTTKGTGLGLYLTQKIIAKHHGRIYVKDNLPKGSIFVIEIPLYAR
jgi:signal transduction histidine kinase